MKTSLLVICAIFASVNSIRVHDDETGMPTVQEAKIQAMQMQAQMDEAIAQADQKRAQQQAQYDSNI